MPYNTRRKSLSLPSLGIQLPQSSRASVANRSSQSTTPATSAEAPPSKRVKRSHSNAAPPLSLNTNTKSSRRTAVAHEQTPPPSPRGSSEPRIDIDGIGDEIVVGVILQLEKTGNKPQLVKELAAVLCNTLDVVESSANPQAIISSRLNSYLKRPWTALSPCPLAKTLIPTHPRRIYYYLTNQPHQPLPSYSSESPLPSNRRAIISPSLTSDDDQEARRRATLSPSPEVDLSIPELEEELDVYGPPTPAGSFSGRSSLSRDGTHPDSEVMSRRAMSPPLEGDEREFTQTASAMQSKRSFSGGDHHMNVDVKMEIRNSIEGEDKPIDQQDHPDDERRRHSEAAATLFGQSPSHGSSSSSSGSSTIMGVGMMMSSPIVRPSAGLHINTNLSSSIFSSPMRRRTTTMGDTDTMMMDVDQNVSIPDLNWGVGVGSGIGVTGELQSPENIELEELDDLLGGF